MISRPGSSINVFAFQLVYKTRVSFKRNYLSNFVSVWRFLMPYELNLNAFQSLFSMLILGESF